MLSGIQGDPESLSPVLPRSAFGRSGGRNSRSSFRQPGYLLRRPVALRPRLAAGFPESRTAGLIPGGKAFSRIYSDREHPTKHLFKRHHAVLRCVVEKKPEHPGAVPSSSKRPKRDG